MRIKRAHQAREQIGGASLLVLALLFGLPSGGGVVSRNYIRTVWQIGHPDRRFTEFALAPDQARRFAEVFPKGVQFVVGETPLSRFPFLHPSSADSAWGGRAEVPFNIRFLLADISDGVYALHVALADSHESLPSTMVVTVNGNKVWERRMTRGKGRAFFGQEEGEPASFTIPLPRSVIRKGDNELTIVLKDGSWVAYDCVELLQWTAPEVLPSQPKSPRATSPSVEAFISQSAALFPLPAGYHAKGRHGTILLDTPLIDSGCRVDFSLSIFSGRLTVGRTQLAEDEPDIWQIGLAREGDKVCISPLYTRPSLPLSPTSSYTFQPYSGWLRLTIEQDWDRVVCTVRNGGKVLGQITIVHPPVPPGRLCWRGAEAEWAVADLCCQETKRRKPKPPSLKGKTPSYKTSETTRPLVRYNNKRGEIVLANSSLELRISTRGGINPGVLWDKRTQRQYADGRYCYGSPDQPLPKLQSAPKIIRYKNGNVQVTLTGELILLNRSPLSRPSYGVEIATQDHLLIVHQFRMGSNFLEERIAVTNIGRLPADLAGRTFGFAKRLLNREGWNRDLDGCRFVATPYRREPESGQLLDFSAEEIGWRSGWFHLVNYPGVPQFLRYRTGGSFGSEGWVWLDSDGDHGLVIAKYNREEMEWSALNVLTASGIEGEQKVLIFGGARAWKLGDPEKTHSLQPGQSVTFGVTRMIPVTGGWRGGYYAFRHWMDGLGHTPPKNYNPPVHWNELYDNPLWWGPDTPERRRQFYRLQDMEEEARKAQELGCEALYLDPGWDTSFASSIWAEDRLGRQKDFVKMLKDGYSLQLSLHTPLAGWSDITAYPEDARRKGIDGKSLSSLCSSAPSYLKTKAERLLRLCGDGAGFLMLDGSGFTGACYDHRHGHSVPLTRSEHCRSYLRLIQEVKRQFPRVLIELHDPIVAGVNVRYAPTYFLHGLRDSFDELWGYEFMWDPMTDLMTGRALSLYYVRLAYNIPIYLHIDLRKDNENALIFWWYASTCQHLGVGGKHPDPKVWTAHKRAMGTYLRLKRFYTNGDFYGIDETVHTHTLQGAAGKPSEPIAVINVFNLSDAPADKTFRFRLSEIGLNDRIQVHCPTAPLRQNGDSITISLFLPPRSPALLEIYRVL